MNEEVFCIINYDKKDIVNAYRLSLDHTLGFIFIVASIVLTKFIPYFISVSIIILLSIYILLSYLTAGKNKFNSPKYKDTKYINICNEGIYLCTSEGKKDELLPWHEFLTATWNKSVIIIYYRQSKDFAIIPTKSIRTDEQQTVLNILRTVFKL